MTVLGWLITLWLATALAFPIQDTSGTYRRHHIGLERRANQLPEPEYAPDELAARYRQVYEKLEDAFKRDRDLWYRFNRALGRHVSSSSCP